MRGCELPIYDVYNCVDELVHSKNKGTKTSSRRAKYNSILYKQSAFASPYCCVGDRSSIEGSRSFLLLSHHQAISGCVSSATICDFLPSAAHALYTINIAIAATIISAAGRALFNWSARSSVTSLYSAATGSPGATSKHAGASMPACAARSRPSSLGTHSHLPNISQCVFPCW